MSLKDEAYFGKHNISVVTLGLTIWKEMKYYSLHWNRVIQYMLDLYVRYWEESQNLWYWYCLC